MSNDLGANKTALAYVAVAIFRLLIKTLTINSLQWSICTIIPVNSPVITWSWDPIAGRSIHVRNRRPRRSTWPTKSLSKFDVCVARLYEATMIMA